MRSSALLAPIPMGPKSSSIIVLYSHSSQAGLSARPLSSTYLETNGSPQIMHSGIVAIALTAGFSCWIFFDIVSSFHMKVICNLEHAGLLPAGLPLWRDMVVHLVHESLDNFRRQGIDLVGEYERLLPVGGVDLLY